MASLTQRIRRKYRAGAWPSPDQRQRWDEIAFHHAIKDGTWSNGESIEGHIGLAELIAETKASIAASEPPEIKHPNERDQVRLEQIWNDNSMKAKLRPLIVEIATAGGAVISPAIRPNTPLGRRSPIIRIFSESDCWLEFVDDELVRATLIRSKSSEGLVTTSVIRHLEIHTPGQIRHEIWKGTDSELGAPYTDNEYSKILEYCQDRPSSNVGVIETGIDEILVRYVRNKRKVGSPYGVSDFANKEIAFEELDQLSRHLLRNARLARLTLFASYETLGKNPDRLLEDANIVRLMGDEDDLDYKVLSPDPKFNDWLKAINDKIDQILTTHRVSAQTVGRDTSGGASSGTARRLMMLQTLSDVAGTAGACQDELAHAMRLCALLDEQAYEGIEKQAVKWADADALPTVAFRDGVPLDPTEQTARVQGEYKAGIRSLRSAVQLANPDWSEVQVDEELKRIVSGPEEDLSLKPAAANGSNGATDQDQIDGLLRDAGHDV